MIHARAVLEHLPQRETLLDRIAVQGGTPAAKFWSLTLETLRARIVDAGVLTEPELDDAQALLANPQFWNLGPAWVATWGTRPA